MALPEKSNKRLVVATALIVAVIFLGDLVVPLGIAGGVLYVVVILLAMWLPKRFVYGYAVVCTLLTVAGLFASFEGGVLLTDLANRIVAIFAIWVVAVLGLHRKALSERVLHHGQIIDQVQDGVITVGMDGLIEYWNSGAQNIFGYSEDEILGRSIAQLYVSGLPEAVGEKVLEQLFTEKSCELETRGKKKGGGTLVMRQWLLLRRGEDNHPAGVIMHVSDVTKRREAERAATRMEAFYQNVLDELPLQVAIFDAEGRFLYLNPASLSSPEARAWIVGRTEREYFEQVGRNIPAVDTRDIHRRRAMKERTTVTYEEEFETRSGEIRSYLHGFFPVVGSDGEIDKVLGYRYDITDHKRTAWALQESLARLKAVVDTAGDGIITINGDGTIESCNQAAQRLFGFQAAEAIGLHIDTLLRSGSTAEKVGFHQGNLMWADADSPAGIRELSATRKDGTTFPVEVATSRLELDGQHLFTVILRDLTLRKRSERALLRYNKRLEAFRQMDQAILSASSTHAVAKVAVDHLLHMIPAGKVCIALFDNGDNTASTFSVHCDGTTSREDAVDLDKLMDSIEDQRTDGRKSAQLVLAIGRQERMDHVDIPLLVQDAAIGLLKLEAREGESFDNEDVDIAREVAGVLAIAIQDSRLFEEVDASRKRLRALSHRLVQVQEQERRLIARELHDEIGQALTGLKFSLETLEGQVAAARVEQVRESRSIALQLLGRVRDLSLDLRPAMLDDLGLLPALLWLTDRYSRQTGVEVDFRHSRLEQRFDPEIETAAYRIVQEALTNVARHSGCRRTEVFVMASDRSLVARVKDDGVGFLLKDAVARQDSSGLSGMNERASLLGGMLTVESNPGKGTSITAEFPVAAPQTVET